MRGGAVVRGQWRAAAGIALGLAFSLALTGAISADPLGNVASAATNVGSIPTGSGTVGLAERTVTYCTDGGVALSMSLFAPIGGSHPAPTVLQVHGGRWQTGSRMTSLTESETATDLVRAGFLVASIDYRLAPANPWPDQIVDVECAVRFLRAHAAGLGIDPDRIAAWGTSAGGQLVSLLATAPHDGPWDNGAFASVSDQVEAVVDEFGPANLMATDWPRASSAFIRTVFGTLPGAGSDVLRAASPLTDVAPDDPPFLILQGTDDQVVPPSQSVDLATRLRSAGVPVDLVLVHGGQHGLMTPGETPSPSGISSLITSYLERTLTHRAVS
jgi:acetyl esterase/lipase